MKTARKIFAAVIAVALVFAFCLTAFATDGKGSITIINPKADATYTAVKIFDVTYSGDNYSYTIKSTDPAYNKVAAYAARSDSGLTLTLNGDVYVATVDDTFSAAAFAAYLKGYSAELGTGTAFVKGTDGKVKATDLDLGYYFITGTSGSVCELTTAKDIAINDKNEGQEIDKTVDDADKTVEVGQVLTFTLTSAVPSTAGYQTYSYVISDTMTEGLTFNEDVKVYIDGVEITEGFVLTNNATGFVVEFDMMNLQDKAGAELKVVYTATVNEKAIVRNEEINTATLKYSNNPSDSTSTTTTTDEEKVYSYNINVDKYDTKDETKKLEGAKFVLKNAAGKFYKYDETTKTVSWVDAQEDATEVVTDENGAASFNGLEQGTYYLVETEAPAGFNKLVNPITIVISKDGTSYVGDNATTLNATDLSLTAKVANSSGSILPETGGTGTMIFIIVGTLAVLCAGIFLVTNKRMSKEAI